MVTSVCAESFLFFFYCSVDHRDLHSFPTRRSSDLRVRRCWDIADLHAGCGLHRPGLVLLPGKRRTGDRKSTRLNSSHVRISYAVFCLKKKKKIEEITLDVLEATQESRVSHDHHQSV